MPRATQDVDVMVPYSQKTRATKAVQAAWPTLEMTELSQVVRFHDPGDLDADGNSKPVIDIMLPWGKYQETILADHVVIDEATGDRIPTIEAAVVSKYAAFISPHRDIEKREYDAGDLRRLIKANHAQIDQSVLQKLAGQVWEHGAEDIQRFVNRGGSTTNRLSRRDCAVLRRRKALAESRQFGNGSCSVGVKDNC